MERKVNHSPSVNLLMKHSKHEDADLFITINNISTNDSVIVWENLWD